MTPHVLVVDDEREMVKVVQRHLEGEGFVVTPANSGADAVAVLARDEYDVILTDLVMDTVDGLAVLREAQRLQPGRARDPDDGVRELGDGDRRDAAGGLRLPLQALQNG